MVTTRILYRTFYIRFEHFLGTAFTFERGDVQYLATAAHIFRYADNHQEVEISIMHNNEWQPMHSRVHKHANPNIDIAILELNHDLSERHLVRYDIGGVLLIEIVHNENTWNDEPPVILNRLISRAIEDNPDRVGEPIKIVRVSGRDGTEWLQ